MDYAVVDVETTGLFPGGHDRIFEVAIVLAEDVTLGGPKSWLGRVGVLLRLC